MLIVTAKMPKRRLTLGVGLAALLCCCAIALNFGQSAQEVSASNLPSPKGVKSNQDRINYLSAYGWQVSPDPVATQELVIPKEMDDVFSNYNEIQKAQGCDLTKYAGKRCKRYTYIVNNYPDQPENIRANIVTYKNKIIGGDVCSIELNGFMHGFAAETD